MQRVLWLAVVGFSVVLAHVGIPVAHAGPTPSTCSRVQCGGSCTIRPPCTPGKACPDYVLLGECSLDATGACQCEPVKTPTPTPTPIPTVTECNPSEADSCPADHQCLCCCGTWRCMPPFLPCCALPCSSPPPPLTPTATPTPPSSCSGVPCGGPCAAPFPSTCPPGALCVGVGQCELNSAGTCACVPVTSLPTPTPAPCVDNVLCILGSHWSPERCACVPDRPHSPHAPHAPHLPQRQQSAELRCRNSGGTVASALCCASASDYPNTCLIGACGCAPDASHAVSVCDCGDGRCFDGTSCTDAH